MKLFRKQREDNVKQDKTNKTKSRAGWKAVLPIVTTLIFSGCAAKTGDLQLRAPSDESYHKYCSGITFSRTYHPTPSGIGYTTLSGYGEPKCKNIPEPSVEHKKISELYNFCLGGEGKGSTHNEYECEEFGKELAKIRDLDAVPYILSLITSAKSQLYPISLYTEEMEPLVRGGIEALIGMNSIEVFDVLLGMLESGKIEQVNIALEYLEVLDKPYFENYVNPDQYIIAILKENYWIDDGVVEFFKNEGESAIEELKRALLSDDDKMQAKAVEVLHELDMLIPVLKEFLEGEEHEILRAFSVIDAIAVSYSRSLDETPKEDEWLYNAIGLRVELPHSFDEKVPKSLSNDLINPLKNLALSDGVNAAMPAAKFLSEIKTDAASDTLVTVLADSKSTDARIIAAKELGYRKYQKAEDSLIDILRNVDYSEDEKTSSLRRTAMNVLRELGSKKAVPYLVDALVEEYYPARVALEIICKGSTCPIELIPRYLNKLEESIDAGKELYYSDATGAFDTLVAVVDIHDFGESLQCYKEILSKFDDGKLPLSQNSMTHALVKLVGENVAGPDMLKRLNSMKWKNLKKNWREDKHGDVDKAIALIDALGELKYEKAVKSLIKIMNDKTFDTSVRESAVDALGAIGSKNAVSALKKMSSKEQALQKKYDKLSTEMDIINASLNVLYEKGMDWEYKKVKNLFSKLFKVESAIYPLNEELDIAGSASYELEKLGVK